MKAASETLTPVILELGGKDAAVIFADCDYASTLDFCLRAAFQNSGQNCAGLERMIVQEPIYERVVADVAKTVSKMTQGAPLAGVVDVGAMTMAVQVRFLS
jgi:acyl-CoA reductase-like NAD-dependent aldehyde dehydrogenase